MYIVNKHLDRTQESIGSRQLLEPLHLQLKTIVPADETNYSEQRLERDVASNFLMLALTSTQAPENGLIINDLAHKRAQKYRYTIEKDNPRLVLVKGKNQVRLRN